MDKKKVSMWVDGSSKLTGAARLGGYAAVLEYQGKRKVISGGARGVDATNNAMELQAVLQGIRALNQPCTIVVYCDSRDVIGWLQRGFKVNKDHLETIVEQIRDEVVKGDHVILFQKVQAHSGNSLNELADARAKEARDQLLREQIVPAG